MNHPEMIRADIVLAIRINASNAATPSPFGKSIWAFSKPVALAPLECPL